VKLACAKALALSGGSQVVAVDTALEDILCKGEGKVLVERRVDVRFVDAHDRPIEGAEVRARGGDLLARAGADGRIRERLLVKVWRCPDGENWVRQEASVMVQESSRPLDLSAVSGDVVLETIEK
jgi:hypothetical protein